MKKLMLALICLMISVFSANALTQTEWDTLIEAIAIVESNKNPNAVNGRHLGYLQISPCVVTDCNQYQKKVKYTLNDRRSISKSIEMFRICQERYNPEGNLEKAIRIWNGGPRYKVASTERYYRKVMKHYNALMEKRKK